jgi:GTP-binding protein
MLDDELKTAIAETLPPELPLLFISSITNQGITELKDALWKALNDS